MAVIACTAPSSQPTENNHTERLANYTVQTAALLGSYFDSQSQCEQRSAPPVLSINKHDEARSPVVLLRLGAW